MEALARARRIADYLVECGIDLIPSEPAPVHNHFGATLADAILQAGLNYRTVVLPRVLRLKQLWPTANSAKGLLNCISRHGAHRILNWKDDEKPRRLEDLAKLLFDNGVETETDLSLWLAPHEHRELLLELKGVGPKTVDYLARLVGAPTIAVDRHIRNFVENVCPQCRSYEDVQEAVCYAADLLGVHRGWLDRAIWKFMSSERARREGRRRAA